MELKRVQDWIDRNEPKASNCTNMELKQIESIKAEIEKRASNCTNMELKHDNCFRVG